ncbi:flagellar hook-basal body complex protein [Litorivicinus lipolyticus]|uniref:Flagellar basal-body rod protein FlgF n=1 Tax=Litorivicinus lipolyticus TaxID=418701 RepID=A0A5Q2QAE4_9GAMM|nr:flagellar basal body rod protein FlgF [Litorivicinus lipolyticus]QGG80213.1 flagellar hook-basal body complex protein [Litorivicinus lipolyticus]
MDKAIYMASQTATNMMRAQALVANNMANAATSGFKADRFTMVSQEITGGEYGARSTARLAGGGVDLTAGPMQQTGRDLDVAISGRSLFAVQVNEDQQAFTRNGDFKVSPEGLLTTQQGQPVLGELGVIPVPVYESISIGQDGSVSVVPPGGGMVRLDRLKMVTPVENLDVFKGDDGLIRFKGEVPEPDITATLQSGFLEGSNVNGASALVELMNLSRQFEMSVNLMSRLDDAESSANDAISSN